MTFLRTKAPGPPAGKLVQSRYTSHMLVILPLPCRDRAMVYQAWLPPTELRVALFTVLHTLAFCCMSI